MTGVPRNRIAWTGAWSRAHNNSRYEELLPRCAWPQTGLAYPVSKIRQEGSGSEWKISREWII